MASFQSYPSGSTLGLTTTYFNDPGPYYITSSSSSSGYTLTSASAGSVREPTALEWLDAEVERTCALARL